MDRTRCGVRAGWTRSLACALGGALAAGIAPARAAAVDAPPAPAAPAPAPGYRPTAAERAFVARLERDTFRFFWDATPAATGLTPDRTPGADVSSVAAVGFALTAYCIGAERGWVARSDAAARTLATLRTLWRAPQGPAPAGVAGREGLFYHFLDARRAVRANASELSTIDTALLMAGVLSAEAYFDRDAPAERAIRRLGDRLYRRVDWAWLASRAHPPLLGMGWTPEGGFLDADWRGYDEGMILYVLAIGSPTHPVDPRAWDAWTRSYRWAAAWGGRPHVTFGPLFGHQYSQAWIDFRGIQDRYMRARGSDYFENSVAATRANRAYCVANPGRWRGYGPLAWGLTASDGPGDAAGPAGAAARFHGYWARGDDASTDDGTLAPTAAGGSIAFAPELAVPTLAHLRERLGDRVYGRYGFKDAFNLSWPGKDGAAPGWFDDAWLGIDEGPILLMIENYRSGLVWRLLRRSPYVVAGLRRAGFRGGWLDAPPDGPTPARALGATASSPRPAGLAAATGEVDPATSLPPP